jgi:hypothetical protein
MLKLPILDDFMKYNANNIIINSETILKNCQTYMKCDRGMINEYIYGKAFTYSEMKIKLNDK